MDIMCSIQQAWHGNCWEPLFLYIPPPFHPHLIVPPPLGGHLVPYQTCPPLPSSPPFSISSHPLYFSSCSDSLTQSCRIKWSSGFLWDQCINLHGNLFCTSSFFVPALVAHVWSDHKALKYAGWSRHIGLFRNLEINLDIIHSSGHFTWWASVLQRRTGSVPVWHLFAVYWMSTIIALMHGHPNWWPCKALMQVSQMITAKPEGSNQFS